MKKSKLLALDALSERMYIENPLIRKLKERYSDAELREIANGERKSDARMEAGRVDFDGNRVKFGFFTDPHIGSLWDTPQWIFQAFERWRKDKCEFLICGGDLVDGTGMDKKGFVYDLRLIGAKKQKEEAIRIMGEWDRPAYVIAGNHDAWYYKENEYDIVADICKELKFNYLGMGEGRFLLKGKCPVDVFHGEDSGSAYAMTYRVQRMINAMVGGEKPRVLLTGHDHKAFYLFYRNIHVVDGGACSKQSRYSRQKRNEHHSGFWEIDMSINGRGEVTSFRTEWFPFYA